MTDKQNPFCLDDILDKILEAQKAESWHDLLDKLYPISEIICDKLNVDFCSIGLCDNETLLEKSACIKGNKTELTKDVNTGDLKATVVGAFLLQSPYKYWDSKEFLNKLGHPKSFSELNQNEIIGLGIDLNAYNKSKIEHYESDKLLNSKIRDFVCCRIQGLDNKSEEKFNGFIHIINFQEYNSEFEEYIKKTAKYILQAIQSVINKIQKKDYEFLAKTLYKKNVDIEDVIDNFTSYIADEFKSDLTTYRIPVETKDEEGKITHITYNLRKHIIRNYFLTEEDKSQLRQDYYDREDTMQHIDSNKIPYHEHVKKADGEPLVYHSSEELYTNFKEEEYGFEKYFRNRPVLIVPIKMQGNSSFNNSWAEAFGVFHLRPKELYNKDIIINRLKNLASVFAITIENSINRKRYRQIEKFKLKLKGVSTLNLDDTAFYQSIAELIENAMGASACSVLIKDTMNKGLELKYTTAAEIIISENGVNNTVPSKYLINKRVHDFRQNEKCLRNCDHSYGVGACDNPEQIDNSLTCKVYRTGRTIHLPYINKVKYCKRFNEVVEDKNSIIITPIKIDKAIYGVIKCVGKEKDNNSYVNVFWSVEKEFLELLTEIVSHFVENRIATKNKSEFLNHFKHEIRLPMHAIYQSSEIINFLKKKSAYNIPSSIKNYLDKINIEARLLNNIYNDIYLISDLDQKIDLKIKDNSFIESFENVKYILKGEASDKNCRVKIMDEKQLLTFTDKNTNEITYKKYKFDKYRTEQILINLVRNAIRYSHNGQEILIKYSQYADWHIIDIVNYGIGVEPGLEKTMYELYARGENAKAYAAGGTGIGLAVAKRLVEEMNGDVKLQNADQPTIFTLKLPLK